MISFRAFLVLIVMGAAAAARASSTLPGCDGTNTSARMEALISPQIQNTGSGGFCNAMAAFSPHARSKSENELAPTMVRNPFLPASDATPAEGQGRSGKAH